LQLFEKIGRLFLAVCGFGSQLFGLAAQVPGLGLPGL